MNTEFRRVPMVALFSMVLALSLVAGCGSDSEPAGPTIDTVPPAIPAGIANFSTGSDRVSFSWDANVTDPDLAGYVVYRSDSVSGSYQNLSSLVTNNSWTDNTVRAGESYWYRVSAQDATGNESGLSQSFQVTMPNPRPERTDDMNN